MIHKKTYIFLFFIKRAFLRILCVIKIISVFAQWLRIFGIIFAAFMISLYNLYWFYDEFDTNKTRAFTTFCVGILCVCFSSL